MIESEKVYADAAKTGKRFIDQVRTDPPAQADFVERVYKDVRYAEGSAKRYMDIYLPNDGKEPYPVIVDIFGGGWCFGKRSSYKFDMALEFVKKGYAGVSLDYSLSRKARFPTQIYEIKAAIRYLKNHAAEYSLDPERIVIMGESAGAHLGSVSALSVGAGVFEDPLFGEEGDASVKAMIALYCPTNLGLTKGQFAALGLQTWVPEGGRADSPEGILLGGTISDVPEMVRMANPETYVTKKSPAMIFFHGTDDRVVPYLQSLNLAAKLVDTIGSEKVEHHLIQDAQHNQAHFKNETVYEMIEAFLNRQLD